VKLVKEPEPPPLSGIGKIKLPGKYSSQSPFEDLIKRVQPPAVEKLLPGCAEDSSSSGSHPAVGQECSDTSSYLPTDSDTPPAQSDKTPPSKKKSAPHDTGPAMSALPESGDEAPQDQPTNARPVSDSPLNLSHQTLLAVGAGVSAVALVYLVSRARRRRELS
jgi:hypothetical protein